MKEELGIRKRRGRIQENGETNQEFGKAGKEIRIKKEEKNDFGGTFTA
jgi:hypothetical protein